MEQKNSVDLKIGILSSSQEPENNINLDRSINSNKDKPEDKFVDFLDRKADIEVAYKHGLANQLYKIDYKKISNSGKIVFKLS